jgi:DegV family protein with EDD domain
MKIAWITDSTSSLSKEFIESNNVFVVPLNIIFGKESFKENVDITEEKYYQKIRNFNGKLSTSQPAFGDFINLYEKLKVEYDLGIAVHASSKLTGTYESSKIAGQMVGFKLFAIDSKIGSYPISFMIKKGMELINSGTGYKEVVNIIENYSDQSRLVFVPENLDQLHKSGRVSGSAAYLGNLLKIKPILSLEDGEVIVKDKVRTSKKAVQWLLNEFDRSYKVNKIKKLMVVHADVLEEAKEMETTIKEKYPNLDTGILLFIPVVGVHAGVGTIGLSWVNEN